jgi:tetratricopeptide (TPR) repeat protein
MLVTFPFLLLLLDVWPLARMPWLPERNSVFPAASLGRVAIEKAPLLPLSALMCLATLSIQGASLIELPFSERLAVAIQSCWDYLGKALYPYPLYVPYLRSDSEASIVWTVVSGAGLLMITLLATVAYRRRPYLLVGWLWYLGMLVPVIGIVQVGEQSMADRYTYLPLIGIYWILAWGLSELAARGPVLRRTTVATAAVALLVLAAMTSLQVAHWRNTETLFTHTIRYSPRNHVAYSALANDAYTRGEYEKALAWARSALEVKPTASGATAIVAQALARSGQTRESIAAYQQAIAVSPNNAFLMNEFARILATCDDARFRDGQSALRIANRASALYRGQNPHILDTIAAAQAELGAWEQAVHTAEQVRAMAHRSVEAGNADAQPWLNGVEVRLQLYRQQLPYRIAFGVWND